MTLRTIVCGHQVRRLEVYSNLSLDSMRFVGILNFGYLVIHGLASFP